MQVDGHVELAGLGPQDVVSSGIKVCAVSVIIYQGSDEVEHRNSSVQLPRRLGRIRDRKYSQGSESMALIALRDARGELVVALSTTLRAGPP